MLEIKDKIDSIIKYSGLSNAEFAKKVGVSAGLISQIAAGRQKPKYGTLQKIIDTFPELDIAWLFGKKENMLKNNEINNTDEINLFSSHTKEEKTIDQIDRTDKTDELDKEVEKPIVVKQQDVIPETKENINRVSENPTEEKKIIRKENILDKIIFFYSDKSFEIYKNE